MSGKIIPILSVIPQNGSKYLATNLGYYMKKEQNKKMLLIDFDFEYASLGHHFVKESDCNIDTLLMSGWEYENNNFELFERAITSTKLGFDVLVGSSVGRNDFFKTDFISDVLNASVELYDYIFVVVNPKIENPATAITLLNAYKIILVAKNNYTNQLKLESVIMLIEELKRPHTQVNIIFNNNSTNVKNESSLELDFEMPNNFVVFETICFVPRSIDNKNLINKSIFKRKTYNDAVFRRICLLFMELKEVGSINKVEILKIR